MIPEDVLKQIPAEPEAYKDWSRENFKRISVFPKLVLNGVSSDEVLRRFIDLPKLFDLLKNKRLVLPRLRQLMQGDPFECFARKKFANLDRVKLEGHAKKLEYLAPESSHFPMYPPNLSAADHLMFRPEKSRFDSEIQEMTDEELKDAVWYLERERLKNDLVCSCWHKGTFESDAMWKIYATQLGVSISSSVNKMQSGIKMILPKIYAPHAELHLAAVRYEEDTNICEDSEPWLIKRKAFLHEKEVRLYCDLPFAFGSQFELELDVSTLIEEIVISPFIAAWQVSGIKGAIEALLKEINATQIVVRQSKHMQIPKVIWPTVTMPQDEGVLRPLIGKLDDSQ